MIVHPYVHKLEVFEGTRLLKSTFGIIGKTVKDPDNSRRLWTVHGVYAPIAKRAIGGIRARLLDGDGIVTFINQRDLEVLLGMGIPGTTCKWTGKPYPRIGDSDWFGFCMDRDDLADDLMDQELIIRGASKGMLPLGIEVRREVHTDKLTDMEEVLVSSSDMDFDTGIVPDARVETIHNRWTRTHSKRLV